MAQQAGHTKGPWAVNPVNAQVDAFATGEPLPVCQLLWPTDERSEEETFANARLIAAAPDLLEALKQAEQQIDYGQIDAAHRIIIAAIAKASGEAK